MIDAGLAVAFEFVEFAAVAAEGVDDLLWHSYYLKCRVNIERLQ